MSSVPLAVHWGREAAQAARVVDKADNALFIGTKCVRAADGSPGDGICGGPGAVLAGFYATGRPVEDPRTGAQLLPACVADAGRPPCTVTTTVLPMAGFKPSAWPQAWCARGEVVPVCRLSSS